jgi:hypothetical protein
MLMGQGRGGAGTGPPNSRLQHAPWDREHEDAHFRIQNGIRADVTLVLYSDRGKSRRVRPMKIRMRTFGEIKVDGERYDYDLVIEQGGIRKRSKKPSSTPVS